MRISQLFLLACIGFLSACDSVETLSGENDGPQYTRAFISNVTVEAIPMSAPDGTGWDIASGPDLYFEIQDTQGNALVSASAARNDLANNSFPVAWSENVQVSDWNKSYALHLWDIDVSAHDYIGQAGSFAIEDYEEGYASAISLTNGSVRARIHLRWE